MLSAIFRKFNYFCTMAWFKTWFNTPYYHILYKNRDFAEAEQFISLLVNDLSLPKNSKVIDLACGKGRHSVYLNQLGYDVLGLDLSEESILHNKAFENEKLRFEVHDMRSRIEGEKVDAVFNLFTSFGYFEDHQDDRRVFESVHAILKQNGFFVLDFLNEKFVKNSLVSESLVEREGIVFKTNKKIENQHIIKDIRFSDKGEDFHFFEKVKLHTLDEIGKLASESGFERVGVFGNYHLEDFDIENSPRCINIFKKAE